MRVILFVLCLQAAAFSLNGQNVVINEDPKISDMMARMVEINRSDNKLNGWRIQILATTDRQKLEDAKSRFLAKYPALSINWVHAKPYYKLRVGAFTSKLEAVQLLHRLKRDYPSAYPAKDNSITPRELVGL